MKYLISIVLVIWAGLAFTPNNEPSEDPETTFDIEDYSWLAGRWTGDGFGGTSEELWSPPQNGVMMGVYRHHDKDGKLVFYEFLTLDKTGMKLKHFNADMTSWETKEDFVSFGMVEAKPGKLVLKGLVFEKTSETTMEIKLRMRDDNGVRTEVFHMKRAPL